MQEVDDETKETNELSDRRRAPNSDVPSDSNVLNDDDNPEINNGTEPRDSNEQEQWEEAEKVSNSTKLCLGTWALLMAVSGILAAFVATPQEIFEITTPYISRQFACTNRNHHNYIRPPPRWPHVHVQHAADKLAYIHSITSQRYWTVDYHADVLSPSLENFEEEYPVPSSATQEELMQDPIIHAIRWLLYTDTQVTALDRILPRYTLAFLYFFFQEQNYRGRLDHDGSFKENFPNWLSPHVHECDWKGITCACVQDLPTNEEVEKEDVSSLDITNLVCNVIVKVDLSNMGLKGSLANEWTMLSYLQELDLRNNSLRISKDDILYNFSTMPFLKQVFLSGNFITDKRDLRNDLHRHLKGKFSWDFCLEQWTYRLLMRHTFSLATVDF